MVVSPLFWEWFNVWLAQFLKNLYHEIKMVALRGANSSYGNVPHGCGYHGGQPTLDVSQNLQPSLNISHAVPPNIGHHRHHVPNHANHVTTNMNHANHIGHMNHQQHVNHMNHVNHGNHDHHNQKNINQMNNMNHVNHIKSMTRLGHSNHNQGNTSSQSHNGPNINSSVPHLGHVNHSNHGMHMSHNIQLSAHSKQMQFMQQCVKQEQNSRHSNAPRPPQYRVGSQTMPIPGTGAECYHPGGATGPSYMPGGAAGAPNQGMRTQTTPQPSAPPQPEMAKNNMAGHNYVSPPNATPSARPQYPNFQYRATQHTTRPATHARQQQPYMPTAGSTAGGPVMYHPTLLFQPAHMPLSQTYQPRSTTPGFYPYMPYVYTNTNPGHTSPYYYNGQGVAGAGARSSQGPLMPQPAAPHQPPPAPHMPISGIRQGPAKRTSRRVPIINPVTRQDIFSEDIFANDSQYVSGESSERQTPQAQDNSQSIVEEFTRMVNEAANQPTSSESASKSNYVPKCNEVPATTASSMPQPQENAINYINNNIVKSDILIDNKNIGPDVEVETPVVSAMCNSPVIVPKLTNLKQQKSSENLIIDNNKNQKLKAKKPNVPQNETEKQSDVVVTHTVQESSVPVPAPQPQRIREPRERSKPEQEKEKEVEEKEAPKLNGPASVLISSADSTFTPISPQTSQDSETIITETKQKIVKQVSSTLETEPEAEVEVEVVVNSDTTFPESQAPTATQLLSSIEKVAKEQVSASELTEEERSASQAQAKLTQSIVSAARNNPELRMKDINLNTTAPDPDTANGNVTEVGETVKDVNKNEKPVKSSKSKKNKNSSSDSSKNTGTDMGAKETYENGKDETDNVSVDEPESMLEPEEPVPPKQDTPPVFVPKHKYSDDQWSPLNPSGKKTYDIRLLMQIKDDPLCRNKPNVPLLESCNILRSAQLQDSMMAFNQIQRPVNDSLFPNFLKNTNSGNVRSPLPRDNKKDGRNVGQPTGKGSMKLNSPSSASGGRNIFISLREEVKLNETKDAWKPSRLKKENLDEQELKTQELYKKFRGILNKLTPQKFDTLIDKVKSLEIDTQARLEGVIDLVFEKAIDEPNFSEAYAAMCNKLSMLRVPVANSPDQCVNFRAMIISKCQSQFIAEKTDENVIKLEKELAECTDPAKKKEMTLQLVEQQRRVRMRSVGNVRFIGELYKLKMLTSKIMVYCMTYLIEKLEEEKLECLCKLLTTIGEQVESEVKEQLENIFKQMQEIIHDRKSNKISSRVRFMIQDVIELKRRKWVAKNVIDSQPKMMDQIQKEAEQQQRHIELMNSPMGGGFRREEGGGGGGSGRKRGGEGRRQGGGGGGGSGNIFMDNSWKTTSTRSNYTVDTTKLKAMPQKNLSNIKLAPHNSAWNHGSGTKTTTAVTPSISLNKNMYSILENVQADPTSLRGSKDSSPAAYQHSKSIERSTFNSRNDFNSGGRSGSVGGARSDSGTRSPVAPPSEPAPAAPPAPAPAAACVTAPVQQEPLPDNKKKSVKQMVDLCTMNPNDDEMVEEIKLFPPQHHAAIVTEILNVALEKSAKEISLLAKSLLHVVSTGTISTENLMAGMAEIFEYAPDLYLDVPMLYEYLGEFIAPHIEKKNITFVQVHSASESMISSNHGQLLLRAILRRLKESMGPTFTASKWQESGLTFSQWMNADMVSKWVSDNRLEFLEGSGDVQARPEDAERIMTPDETQSKLLQLMNSDESCDCLRGWVKDNIGASTGEEWFLRSVTQAICEHALFGPERGGAAPHLSHDRMNKYSPLIGDYADSQVQGELACLFGIQQLVHRLEHPQGLTLDIFQYLHEQYIISVEGFIAWETSEKEPEGKAVMLKALTSFFTNIREADNEDSCSEA